MAVTNLRTGTSSRKVSRVTRPGAVIGSIVRYTILIVLAILFLIPFYLLLRNGLATEQEITSPHWTLFPSTLHFENISELFSDDSVPFANSLLISALSSLATTTGAILVALCAGYGIARIPYRWNGWVFGAILATLILPGAVTFIPTYTIVSFLGWVGNIWGLIIPGLFSGFTTFLFRQFFLNFPSELEEAARVDGLGYWGILWRIVVPNSFPIIAALTVVGFIGGWNAFLWPLVITGQNENAWTVQVSLSTFLTAQTIELHELFLAALIAILPLIIVFLFLQRYIVEGYTQTGLKG